MSAEIDECIDKLRAGLEIGKPAEFKPPYAQYYGDIEWRLLVLLLKMPGLLPVIKEIVPEPKYFREKTGQTDHRLIYHAMLDLQDEGEIINLTFLYGRCEEYRQDKPLSNGYSRADLFELDFQAIPLLDTRDNDRIEMQYIAGKIKERYFKNRVS